MGGEMSLYGIQIPQAVKEWKEFAEEIEKNCGEFVREIRKVI